MTDAPLLMQSSSSLTAIHPRRLHGRSVSNAIVHPQEPSHPLSSSSSDSHAPFTQILQTARVFWFSSRWRIFMLLYLLFCVVFFTISLFGRWAPWNFDNGDIDEGMLPAYRMNISRSSLTHRLRSAFRSAAIPIQDSSALLTRCVSARCTPWRSPSVYIQSYRNNSLHLGTRLRYWNVARLGSTVGRY